MKVQPSELYADPMLSGIELEHKLLQLACGLVLTERVSAKILHISSAMPISWQSRGLWMRCARSSDVNPCYHEYKNMGTVMCTTVGFSESTLCTLNIANHGES